jgi:hypothetical protein
MFLSVTILLQAVLSVPTPGFQFLQLFGVTVLAHGLIAELFK